MNQFSGKQIIAYTIVINLFVIGGALLDLGSAPLSAMVALNIPILYLVGKKIIDLF